MYDLIVIGGGPAGASALLALRNSGWRVALVERDKFPRDKICGDAIPGPGVRWLERYAPDVHAELFQLSDKHLINSSSLTVDGGHTVALDWKIQTFNAPRQAFDAHLLALARRRCSHDFFAVAAKAVKNEEAGVSVLLANGETLRARHLIAADGANGICARQLLGKAVDERHHCGAVRCYYPMPEGSISGNNEFHLLSKYLPGYFWIFPVNERVANVGFGMLTAELSQRKLNLRRLLPEIIAATPHLRHRFGAPLEKPKGFGLPLGTRRAPLRVGNCLFTGDAASLIDPLYGHGIDKAIISGWLAAACLLRDEPQLYETIIGKKWETVFRRNARYRDAMTKFPGLLRTGVRIAGNERIKSYLKSFVNA